MPKKKGRYILEEKYPKTKDELLKYWKKLSGSSNKSRKKDDRQVGFTPQESHLNNGEP